MKERILITFILAFTGSISAQPAGKSIAGEYYLSGVMETASGFKLNGDSTFQFFFSYGALDRSGEGRWGLINNQVVLNSRQYPGRDFRMKTQKSVAGDFITLKIIDSNRQLVPHVYGGLKKGDKLSEFEANNDGVISFHRQQADTILLVFEFCAERTSSFAIDGTNNNYFEFGFEPWLMEVFFKDFILTLGENELTGKHPLMQGSGFRYKKSE